MIIKQVRWLQPGAENEQKILEVPVQAQILKVSALLLR
jgi:hypothetical protein